MTMSNQANTNVGKTPYVILAILGAIIAFEGGYVNHPNDPGGETKYGITKTTARSYGYSGSMKDLPKDLARKIYKDWYITKPRLDKVIDISPAVGHKVIDAGVNVGISRSVKWLQRALNILSREGQDYPKISEDGVVGQQTLNAYRSLQARRGSKQSCELVLKLMDIQQGQHYINQNKPSFITGWISNRIENIPLSYCTDYKISDDILFEQTTIDR